MITYEWSGWNLCTSWSICIETSLFILLRLSMEIHGSFLYLWSINMFILSHVCMRVTWR